MIPTLKAEAGGLGVWSQCGQPSWVYTVGPVLALGMVVKQHSAFRLVKNDTKLFQLSKTSYDSLKCWNLKHLCICISSLKRQLGNCQLLHCTLYIDFQKVNVL